MLHGISPDSARNAEPTLLADKVYASLRLRLFVSDHGSRPLIPTRRCIPTEQAIGELYTGFYAFVYPAVLVPCAPPHRLFRAHDPARW